MTDKKPSYDLFLSHASEDAPVAREIYLRLAEKGLKIWFDNAEITIGDSIRDSLDNGLRNSRFGVVILSRTFLEKKWTRVELSTLLAKEQPGRKVILPVIHALSADELAELSPILGDRFAANTNSGIEEVVEEIVRAVRKHATVPSLSIPEPASAGRTRIPVILAGCGWWARTRSVFPLYQESPDLFEIVGITTLKKVACPKGLPPKN